MITADQKYIRSLQHKLNCSRHHAELIRRRMKKVHKKVRLAKIGSVESSIFRINQNLEIKTATQIMNEMGVKL